jgi:hypothetical protein
MSAVPAPLTRPEKYEKLAFTFCKLGTAGLIAWALTPPVMVLVVAVIAIALYARAVTLGVSWTRCFLRRPPLIIAVWGVIAILDAIWLFVLQQRLPG